MARLRMGESQTPPIEQAPTLAELHSLYTNNIERIRHGTTGGVAKAQFHYAKVSPDAFEELVDYLEHREFPSLRATATSSWILGQARLSMGQSLRVGKALCYIVQKRRRGLGVGLRRIVRSALLPGVGIVGAGLLGGFALNYAPISVASLFIQRATLVFVPLLGFLICVIRWHALISQRSDAALSAVRTLQKCAIPESLPCLCEAFFDPYLSKAAEKALLSTLPQLTSERYERLDPNLTQNLCDLLLNCTPWHPPLVSALVDALEKVGTKDAIRPLQRVLAQIDKSTFPQAERLWALAGRALEALRERAVTEEERAVDTQEPEYR